MVSSLNMILMLFSTFTINVAKIKIWQWMLSSTEGFYLIWMKRTQLYTLNQLVAIGEEELKKRKLQALRLT